MAHAGYFGQVHFRRDLSQNIDVYRLAAYRKSYDLCKGFNHNNPWTPGFPTPYSSNVGVDGISPMLVFTWPEVSFAGHTWKLICTATKPATPAVDVYQTIEWILDGVLAFRATYGGLFFNGFGDFPAYSPTAPHTGGLPPPYDSDFGDSSIIGNVWPP
jgi:hypothetical protein